VTAVLRPAPVARFLKNSTIFPDRCIPSAILRISLMMSLRIEDYAVIGDCETVALVSRDGSIDWLCWPNFASPACFAALLGTDDHGHWKIAPTAPARATRAYREHTLILETTFVTDGGTVVVQDFMPVRGKNSDIVRMVCGVKGEVAVRMELVLRFDYGLSVPWVTRMKDGRLRAISGGDMAVVHTTAPLRGEDMKTVSDFTVREGDCVPFVLTYGVSWEKPPHPIDASHALRETERFWTHWVSRANLNGDYTEAVERSLITLKALTYRPTGGIVAAATTSVPEQLGGPRNWDYRYCWLRDATFTLLALMHAGYYDEARAWRDWLLRCAAGSPSQIQIMYGIRGERQLMEWEIPWLPGYENSTPVRVGNAASNQLQLDVFGEVADALFNAHAGGIPYETTDMNLQRALTDHLATIWDQPDEGIWEIRGGPRHFTYSKVMAWVAFDRAIRSAEHFGLVGSVDQWRTLRDKIHAEICANAFSAELGTFVQSYGAKQLDAALLLMPLVGFLPPTDPRITGTIDAIEKHLMPDGLILRYDTGSTVDGLPPGEGAFLACSFWMVSALNLCGREADARRLFEHLLSLRNDVGLLSEEYDTFAQRQVGNFPQAFSHIALVNAAFELTRPHSPATQRAARNGPHKSEIPPRMEAK